MQRLLLFVHANKIRWSISYTLLWFERGLGLFWGGFFSFHFHFKVSKIALISHSLPNIFRHKLFNFINWFFTECDPVVFVDFTGKSIVNKSPRRIWIDPTDTQITRSEKGAQYGRFNGITSRISIPFLSGMSITKLMARLRFFTAGTQGPDSQVLFSNCETETVRWNSPEINKDLSPSIAIILNRKLNRLVFLGSTEDRASEQVMMLLPFKVVIFVKHQSNVYAKGLFYEKMGNNQYLLVKVKNKKFSQFNLFYMST